MDGVLEGGAGGAEGNAGVLALLDGAILGLADGVVGVLVGGFEVLDVEEVEPAGDGDRGEETGDEDDDRQFNEGKAGGTIGGR